MLFSKFIDLITPTYIEFTKITINEINRFNYYNSDMSREQESYNKSNNFSMPSIPKPSVPKIR